MKKHIQGFHLKAIDEVVNQNYSYWDVESGIHTSSPVSVDGLGEIDFLICGPCFIYLFYVSAMIGKMTN